MTQRNPMNERYQGDGPGGQTRKSASTAKPKMGTATSVHIEHKPETRSERKAASKRKAKEKQRKEEERAKRRAEKEKAAKIAAGEIVEPEKKTNPIKRFFVGDGSKGDKSKGASGTGKQAARPQNTRRVMPQDEAKYKKLTIAYYSMLGVGVVAVIVSFLGSMYFTNNSILWMVAMGVAYVFVIGALVLDGWKRRPLVNRAQKGNSGLSPKQQKHEQEREASAQRIQKARKAQRRFKLSRKDSAKDDAENAEDADKGVDAFFKSDKNADKEQS
ncbi:MAG: hypothetical protein LBM21_00415 [Coriobacteriales bacterium]|jgi:hypothetical protein|nr:hypothetical protein [Coriobacteriales bacterium]